MAETVTAYVLGFGGGVFVGLIAAMWLIRRPAYGVSPSPSGWPSVSEDEETVRAAIQAAQLVPNRDSDAYEALARLVTRAHGVGVGLIPPDAITVNLVRFAGLDKHKARECEAIVRQVLAAHGVAMPDSSALIDAAFKHSDLYEGREIPANETRAAINNAFFAGATFATRGVKEAS